MFTVPAWWCIFHAHDDNISRRTRRERFVTQVCEYLRTTPVSNETYHFTTCSFPISTAPKRQDFSFPSIVRPQPNASVSRLHSIRAWGANLIAACVVMWRCTVCMFAAARTVENRNRAKKNSSSNETQKHKKPGRLQTHTHTDQRGFINQSTASRTDLWCLSRWRPRVVAASTSTPPMIQLIYLFLRICWVCFFPRLFFRFAHTLSCFFSISTTHNDKSIALTIFFSSVFALLDATSFHYRWRRWGKQRVSVGGLAIVSHNPKGFPFPGQSKAGRFRSYLSVFRCQ